MNTVQLDIRQLQAARHAAAKSDIRYYLNGIYVEAGKGVTRVASTNGHIIYVHDYRHGLDQWEGTFIIPNDTIDMFVKAGKHSYYGMQIALELVQAKDKNLPCDLYRLKLQHGDKVVECRNMLGMFPNYARAVPVQTEGPSIAGHFNLEYVLVWRKVQDVFAKKSDPTIHQNGPTSATAVTFRHLPADHSAIGVMMAMRGDTTYPDTTPFRARLAITGVVEVNSTDTHDPESK